MTKKVWFLVVVGVVAKRRSNDSIHEHPRLKAIMGASALLRVSLENVCSAV